MFIEARQKWIQSWPNDRHSRERAQQLDARKGESANRSIDHFRHAD
jgi:hypothetical protein